MEKEDEYDFTTMEMALRLSEFPPKALKEKAHSKYGIIIFNYAKSSEKEDIYTYVAGLPESEIHALFKDAAKRGTDILKPCCNVCKNAFPSMYEDLPGSHVMGWWIGQCVLDGENRKINSTSNRTSPEWCPLRNENQ